MTFTFLDMTGATLFVRDDAERAEWTQEEMSLNADFPFLPDKHISTGQRIFFIDPSTGSHQIYEVKQAKTLEPDSVQQIVAENICISELTDEHINDIEVTGKTAREALQGVLNGTQWAVGNVSINPTSSADLSRGNVWQGILQIKDNWNVYIEPRVTLSGNGTITRYLDILSTQGTWNGVVLSVDKNFLDPSVTYDDSEVVTALYGYGGQTTSAEPGAEPVEVNFASIVWQSTADHPAKPAGQTYIEDPAATLAYGRNGRARFGFYQNTDITDPNTLLQKTWESLKTQSTPAISIEGTVADLYRMGYADQPIALHDLALVEVLPAGFKKQIQIIRMTTDLLDPSNTVVTIGSYIPNIVYIDRGTNEQVNGRGGKSNKNKDETTWKEFRTTIQAYEDGTGLQIKAVQNNVDITNQEVAVQTGRIDVAYNKITQEVEDRRDADNVLAGRITVQADRITAEVTRAQGAESTLSGRITVEANRISQEVTRATTAENTLSGRITVTANAVTTEVTRATTAEGTLSGRITVNSNRIAIVVSDDGQGNYSANAASIVAGINGQTGSYIKIKADTINLSGYVTATQLNAVNAKIDNLTSGNTNATKLWTTDLQTSNATIAAVLTYQGHQISSLNAYGRNGENIAVLGWHQD